MLKNTALKDITRSQQPFWGKCLIQVKYVKYDEDKLKKCMVCNFFA